MTTGERAKNVIVDRLKCNPEEVTPEADVESDLGADSLTMVDVTLALEAEFEIQIEDGTMDIPMRINFGSDMESNESGLTVGKIVALVESKLAA